MVPGRLFKVENEFYEWIYCCNNLVYVREKWKCSGVSGSSIAETLKWTWCEATHKLMGQAPDKDWIPAPSHHQEAYQQYLARSVLLPPSEDSP